MKSPIPVILSAAILIALTIFCTMVIWAAPARAEPVCGPHAKMATAIGSLFDETLATKASGDNTWGLEIYSNSKTGSWTMLLIDPKIDNACMSAHGRDFEALPQGVPT